MACEDFPCCGHEAGCCPDFDEAGNQLDMKCVCGKSLPITSRYSICDSCMDSASDDYHDMWPEDYSNDDREPW